MKRGVAAALFAVAAAALLVWWRQPKSQPKQVTEPEPPPPVHVYGKPLGYVGNEECAKCHREISEKFQRSEMAQSWSRVGSIEVIEQEGEVHDSKTGLDYKMEWRGGRLFVVESLLDETGDAVHRLEVEAHYVIGSGLQGRSYATDMNGYLTMLPVGWYSEPGRWGLSPGYEVSNVRFDRPVTPECAGCHNSEPTFIAGSGFRYAPPLPAGISCESCHGPGADHVNIQKRVMRDGVPPEEPDMSIVNPARLSPELQQDVCLQCHLLSDVMVLQPGKGPFDFRPGQRLREIRSDFFVTEQSGDRPGSVGHVTRSMKSTCFTSSGGRMTCATCHRPHEPLHETPPGYYNERCLDCHRDRGCSRTLAAGQTAHDGDCVSCHMPRVASANIGHAATTEHWIRRRHEMPVEPAGESRDAKSARARPIGFWGDESDGQLGSALVTGREYLDDHDMLQEGTRLLEQQLRAEFSVDWLFRLGVGYFHLKKWAEAAKCLDDVLRRDPNHAEARAMFGSVLARMGRLEEAAATFEECLRRNPNFAGADSELALLYFDLNRPDRLAQTAKQAMSDHPPNPLVLSLIAKAHLLLNDDLKTAQALVERATTINPFIPAPFMVDAQIAVQLNDVQRGERALRGAIRAEDSFLPAHLALGELLARTGKVNEAIACYERVLEISPGHGVAQRALIRLRATNKTGP
jgi:cytochrome c-type biogenesis protein CcmH/NrfG